VLSLRDEDAVPVDVGEMLQWIPLRRRLGAAAFGTNAYRAGAGEIVIEDHVESPGQEEMYVVVSGRARFRIGDDELEADHGSVVFLPDPTVRRSAHALEDGTIVLGVGGWPERPYHPLPWEPIFLARQALQERDWERAAQILERESGDLRDNHHILYQLARCHAQLGQHELALDELRRALEGDPGKRERAQASEALAPLRELDGWPE